MIDTLITKLKANDHAEEIAAIEKQIEDTVGTEAYAEYKKTVRKTRIRNYAIAVGTSAAVIGAYIWINRTSTGDVVADEIVTETPED